MLSQATKLVLNGLERLKNSIVVVCGNLKFLLINLKNRRKSNVFLNKFCQRYDDQKGKNRTCVTLCG